MALPAQKELSEYGFWRQVRDEHGGRGLLEIYNEAFPEEADFYQKIAEQYGHDTASDILLEALVDPAEVGFGELREEERKPEPPVGFGELRKVEAAMAKQIGKVAQPQLEREQRQAEERKVEEMLAIASFGPEAERPKPDFGEMRRMEAEEISAAREAARPPEVLRGEAAYGAVLTWLREESKKWPEPIPLEADPQWEQKLRFRLENKFYPPEIIDGIVETTRIHGLPAMAGGEIPEWEADWSVKDVPSGMKVFVKGLMLLPKQTAASLVTAMQGYKGASVANKGWADKFVESAQKDMQRTTQQAIEKYKNKKFIPGIKITDVAELPQNLAFSGVSLGAGVGAGLAVGIPTALIPAPGARAAALKAGTAVGALATGTAAFQMASYQFMQEFLEMKDAEVWEEQGRHITVREEERLKAEFNGLAIKHGLWEAIPEAVGGAVGFSILMSPLEKIFTKMGLSKILAARMVTKFAAIYGEEAFTETVTELGQRGIRTAAGMPGGREVNWTDPADWLSALQEVAPATFLLTAVTAGAGAAAVNTAKKIASLKQEIGESHPQYNQFLDKMAYQGKSKEELILEDQILRQLLERQVEAPKRVEEAETDGVQRTMLEAEPLPVLPTEPPTSPTVRRARLVEGDVVFAPVISGEETRLMRAEIIDASDPSTLMVRTEAGALFRTGRSVIKLQEEVTVEEPAAPPEAPVVPPVEEAVAPEAVPPEAPPVVPEPTPPAPIPERPVRRLPEGRATRIDVLTRKNELLAEIDEAIAAAPQVIPKGVKLEKLEFQIDGGVATVGNIQNRLKDFRKRVEATPLQMVAPKPLLKPSKLKPIAATREKIGLLIRGMPNGYFSDGTMIVKGDPPKGKKFDTERAELADPEPVMSLLDHPTEPAEEVYYLSISNQDIGVSEVPIANLDPDNRATPRVIYKSEGKYFAFDQYRHNVFKKRFPNARYGITPEVTGAEAFEREGMLIAYIDNEPVAALMPFKILDTVAMSEPPGLADALDLGVADTAQVIEDHPAPGELDQIETQTEPEFIDQSPPIGQAIRTIVPPELVGKIEREEKDITGLKGIILRLGPARTLAMNNPVWNRIIHMARDTLEGMAIQRTRYAERVDKVFKGIKQDEVEQFIDLLEAKGRPDNIPPHLVSAYDEIKAITEEFYAIARDDIGIAVEKWGMTPEEYWPHIFVGKYEIVTPKIGKKGQPVWGHIEAGFARNLNEAVDKAMAFLEENPEADIRIRPRGFKGEYSSVPLTRKGFWRFVSETAKATELDKEEVLSMMKGVAKIKPRGKYVGNFRQRETNLGGYMKDKVALKIYMDRVLRKKWLDPFNKEASDLAMSLPPALKKYALDYIDSVVGVYNPYDNRYIIKRAAAKITRAESVLKLGYRPTTATVNRLQPMQLAFPEIGHYLWRGWAWKRTDEGRQIIEDSGILGDLPYYASGEMGEYARRIGRLTHPLGLFTKAEMENRKDVICGGYLFAQKIYGMDRAKAEKKGFDYIYAYLDQYGGDTREAALQYAKDLNSDVNFIYSNADLPKMFKTTGGRVVLQFKTYPINYLATTMKWTLQKPNNVHYYTRLGRLVATNVILGGVRSTPYIGKKFFQALMFSPVIAALLPDTDRDYARKILGRGIFATLGMDLSTRLGPNEFIPQSLRQFTGPFGSDLYTLYQYVRGDITWDQFLRVAPAVKDINTALAANEYIVDPNRRMRNVVKVMGWEKFLEGIGVPSVKRQVVRDIQSMMFEMDRGYKDNKARRIDAIIAEIRALDTTQPKAVLREQIDAVFDRGMVEALQEGIYIQEKDVYREMDAKQDPQLLRAYDTAPLDVRPELRRRFERLQKVYKIFD